MDLKKHLFEAAERGDAEAQFNLGMIHENGSGDGRYAEGSRPEAMRWFLAAAEQGLSRAQLKLAEMYASERGSSESSEKACGWFLLAAASLQGARLKKAQSDYQRASSRLTETQVAKVRRFVHAWKPKTPDIAAEFEIPVRG